MTQYSTFAAALDKEELSPQQAFALFWSDEELQDISLEGSDGLTVPANRITLAAKSQVFRKMLLGDFSEARQDVVKIESFPSTVLSALVEYIYTDNTSVLAGLVEEVSCDDCMEELKLLLSLSLAGGFFSLPRLCQRAMAAISIQLHKHPTLSLAFLEACHEAGPSTPQEVIDLAWFIIRSGAIVDVVGSIAKLSIASLLEEFLQDRQLALDDCQKFEILNLWQFLGHQEESRSAIAAKALVAKHVRLDWMDPHILATTVSSSCLVSETELLEAYKKQALLAMDRYCVDFAQRPCPAVWKESRCLIFSKDSHSQSHVFDVLTCPSPMVAGTIHSWTIRVEKLHLNSSIELGIAKKAEKVNSFIGINDSTWGYENWGRTYHNGERVSDKFPTYATGSIVTFELNLLPDGVRPGMLSASVDGGGCFQLFDNLLKSMDKEGLVPAASMDGLGSLHLLSFEKIGIK